jgi:hypothetical protein
LFGPPGYQTKAMQVTTQENIILPITSQQREKENMNYLLRVGLKQ